MDGARRTLLALYLRSAADRSGSVYKHTTHNRLSAAMCVRRSTTTHSLSAVASRQAGVDGCRSGSFPAAAAAHQQELVWELRAASASRGSERAAAMHTDASTVRGGTILVLAK